MHMGLTHSHVKHAVPLAPGAALVRNVQLSLPQTQHVLRADHSRPMYLLQVLTWLLLTVMYLPPLRIPGFTATQCHHL